MNLFLDAIHFLAGLLILAEALNKLERTQIFGPHVSLRQLAAVVLKALAWSVLAVGGAGAVVTPLLPLEAPTLQDVCVIFGFAVLIVRTRVKEG
jgi:hypothetical protein